MIATTWRKQAACRASTSRRSTRSPRTADAAEAKAVCAVCPVRQALEHALAHREREGVWWHDRAGARGSCASAAVGFALSPFLAFRVVFGVLVLPCSTC